MCLRPLKLIDRTVRCNYCVECRINRSYEWAFRLREEAKSATSGWFITLTYSDEHLPEVVDKDGELHMTLKKRDIFPWIRKVQEKHRRMFPDAEKIRYFLKGEYGEDRPHYHLMIFNVQNEMLDYLHNSWQKGWVNRKPIIEQRINYIANYFLKHDYNNEHIEKPFTTMSKKPMLGSSYIDNHKERHLRTGNDKVYGRFNLNIPRTWMDKLLTEEQVERSKEEREKLMVERQIEIYDWAEKNDQYSVMEFLKVRREALQNLFINEQRKKKQL